MKKSLEVRKLNKAERQRLRIIVVLSDKGGVGKSVFARLLLQYFLDCNRPVIGCDCDRSNQSLLDYYQRMVEVILAFFSEDPKKAWKADFILEAVLEHLKDIIVDTPAQVFRSVTAYLHQGGLKAAQQQGVEYLLFIVIADRYSLEQFIDLVHEFGDDIPFLIALNKGCCDDFAFVEESDEFQSIIKSLKIPVITIPELPYREREIIDQYRLSFSEALQSTDLTIVGRQRVADFLSECFEQLDDLNQLKEGDNGLSTNA
ncbi:MAG: hypothetical protein AAGA75_00475 [Cyanobacteria bacterium P01_E01_bin.6]